MTPAKVSPETEKKLREAMKRLLTGNPSCTDGTLTKTNLAREAGVSRATMNRATELLNEWNAEVTDRRPRSTEISALEEEIRALRAMVTDLRSKNAELRTHTQGAATVIAELDAQLRRSRHDRLTSPVPLFPS